MERKILAEVPDFPQSKCFEQLKELTNKLMQCISANKNFKSKEKESYTRILKEIDWGMSKIIPKWPAEVERMMQNFRRAMLDFELSLGQSGKTWICGTEDKEKSPEIVFRNVIGYQQVFALIGHYQDRNLREEFVGSIINAYEKIAPRPTVQPQVIIQQEKTKEIPKSNQDARLEKCQYCELYLSLSLLPNGSVARELLSTLPDVEWINGMLYEEGKVFPQDIPKAISYYEKAVKKNNAEALYKLGSLNEQGLYQKGRPTEYIKMWERAAKMGSLEAMTDMGYLYQKGVRDEETGQVILSPDSERAHEYYKEAARNNFPRGLNNLGSFYQLDRNYKNMNKSLQYFNKAIDAGYVKAMFNLGLCYSKGFLETTDRDKAKKLFKRAAELGDHYSKLFYVDMLLNGDTSNCSEDELYEANKFCREMIAEEEERAEAYYFLGIMYEAGLGAPQEPKTSLLYFLKAAKLNYVHAVIKLADCYRTGFGVEMDYKEALRYYQQVANQRPEVLVSIGQMYEEGSDDLRRDYERAFQCYYEGCNKGVPEAFNKVGSMYKQGKHVKRDESKANEYFAKARQLAQDNLTSSRTSLMQSQSGMMIHSNIQRPRK